MRYACECCGKSRGSGVWINKGLVSGNLICDRCLRASRSITLHHCACAVCRSVQDRKFGPTERAAWWERVSARLFRRGVSR